MKDYRKYIEKINSIKDKSEEVIIGLIPELEPIVIQLLLRAIKNNIETKKGVFIETPETINELNLFTADFLQSLQEIDILQKGVGGMLKELRTAKDTISDFQDVKPSVLSVQQSILESSIIDTLLLNGLNEGIVQPLRDALHVNISTGTRLQDAEKYFEDYVASGKDTDGLLAKNLKGNAMLAVDSYTGGLNKHLMTLFDFSHLIMSGSEIKTSSPQCKLGLNELGGIFTEKQFIKILLPVAENNGLIEGTTFKTLPLNKLHWFCRHEFTPANLEEGDIIGIREIFNN